MMGGGGGVRLKIVSGMLGALLLAGVMSGCTSARSSLGTTDSACYESLPTAAQAVMGHGHFVGIHLFTKTQLTKMAPRLVDDLADKFKTTATRVCVAAYEGTFTSADVAKPLGHASGKLAVVVVNAANHQLLGTDIIKRAPLRFGHPHVG
jgi:hypothetical protein